MSKFFILDDAGKVQAVPDCLTWARWFETAKRHVALDDLPGGVRVSTVFLGLDHGFGLTAQPLLFETMIFGGAHDEYQERYATRDEALAGHAKALALAKRQPA